MRRRTLKTSFAGGELADALEGRVDIQRYFNSVRTAKNFYTTRFGSMSNRQGTEYVCKSLSPTTNALGKDRLVPFQFSVTQTYMLEFTNNIMRVLKDGGLVLTSRQGGNYTWTNSVLGTDEWYLKLSAANPFADGTSVNECWEDSVLMTQGTAGSLSAGEWGLGDNDSLGYTTLYVRLTATGDPDTEAVVSTDYQLYTGLDSDSVESMTFTQSADTLFLGGAFFPKSITRTGHDAWTIANTAFNPSGTPPTDLHFTSVGFTTSERQCFYKVAALDTNGKESLPSSELTVDMDNVWNSGDLIKLFWRNISDGTDSSPLFQWTLSTGGGTAEYYLEANGGGTSGISQPDTIWEDKVAMTSATVGSLTVGQWGWGDVDGLGFDTIYVRITGGVDPDTKANGYLSYGYDTDVQWRLYKNYRGDWGWIGDVDKPWFTDDDVEANISVAPKEDNTTFDSLDSNTFPRAVGLFQQRLFYARTDDQPQTVFASQVGDLTNFTISRPLSSEDSIEATLYSGGRVDEIRHLVPLDKLILLTTGSEWVLNGDGDNNTITPFSIAYVQQGFAGCSTTVGPLVINNECLFVQRDNRDIRSMRFKFEDDNYLGDIMTYFVPHIFEDKRIVGWCFQKHPQNLIWIVLDDGEIAIMTYIPEQELIAFTRGDTNGKFIACASIPADTDDEVYFITERSVNGSKVRYIEKLSSREFGSNVRDAKFLDSALTYDESQSINAVAITATEITVTPSASVAHGLSNGDFILIDDAVGITSTAALEEYPTFNDQYYKVANASTYSFEIETISGTALTSTHFTGTYEADSASLHLCTNSVSGLDHLEGEGVDVLADGMHIGSFTVSSGAITLGTKDPGYAVVHAGLQYDCDMQTLRLETLTRGEETLQGLSKRIVRIEPRFKDSVGGKIGTSEDDLTTIKWRQYEYGLQPNALKTGDTEHLVDGNWDDEGYVFFRQDSPLPTNIMLYTIEYEVGNN